MSSSPVIFDRALQSRWRDRAAGHFVTHHALKQLAVERLADRLDDMKRDFPLGVDLGGHRGEMAEALRGHTKIGSLITAEACFGMVRSAPPPAIVADEEWLPFADSSLDLVMSALSLHRVNDLPGTLMQIRRALKPDGLLLANFAGGRTLHELAASFAQAESDITGGIHPRVSPWVDVRDAGALLQRAGFALPVVDSETIIVTYPDIFALMRELRLMGEANALMTRSRRFLPRRVLERVAEIYQRSYATPDGRIHATFELITLTGWAPHSSQQHPLPRGSATHRLADALKADEQAQQ